MTLRDLGRDLGNRGLYLGLMMAALAASPAAAAVVTSLPGGTALAIPAAGLIGVSGPISFGPGATYISNQESAFGYTDAYNFGGNGDWTGTPMIGLDAERGSFDLAFDAPVSGFLGEIDWTTVSGVNASIAIYDSVGTLLESLTLENDGNLVTPGYWGFSRATADISKVRFSNEYIGVRNITTLVAGAVPEPASWAMLIAGFGLTGAVLRRRRRAIA
jgi:hypothetical protein